MQERRILTYIDKEDIPSSATSDILTGDSFNVAYIPTGYLSYPSWTIDSIPTSNSYLYVGCSDYQQKPLYCSNNGEYFRLTLSSSLTGVTKFIDGTQYYLFTILFYGGVMIGRASNINNKFTGICTFGITASAVQSTYLRYAGVLNQYMGYVKLKFSNTCRALNDVTKVNGYNPIYIDNE